MASNLHTLRTQLGGLRQARRNARISTAALALGTALLISLGCVFAIDFWFQRQIQSPQRAVLLLLAVAAIAWTYHKFAWPLLTVEESEVDMALLVERQHRIDSDFVAALQFEPDIEGRWGSRQLETAVMESVSHVGADIDVYQGFDRAQFNRRAGILGGLAVAVLIAALLFPGHFAAFLNRIALGSEHYPSKTQVASISINGRNVLTRGMRPANIRCAEGRPINFLVRCGGTVPEQGQLLLASQHGGERTELQLTALSPEQRVARLQSAQQMVQEALKSPTADLAGPWFEQLEELVQFEAPESWSALGLEPLVASASEFDAQLRAALPAINQTLARLIVDPPPTNGPAGLFVGQLPRLNEAVRYRLQMGDAYTDPAEITMIALPSIEASLSPVPPKYAAQALASDRSGRQAAVLMGSEVGVAVECTNEKPLREAWIVVREGNGAKPQRFALTPLDDARLRWQLSEKSTPFAKVVEELRYELQVTDEDGLHPETPIRGSVRIRVDKPPVAMMSTVHRVVRSVARPTIQYRVGDDFGLRRLELVAEVERFADHAKSASSNASTADSTATSSDSKAAEAIPPETTRFKLLTSSPITLERLPLAGKVALDLASLKLDSSRGPLAKGDRLKLVLEAEDDRGGPGETFRSEPIIIEVSDDLGVLGAVGEADPQAAQRLDEILKRELGIGETP